MCSVALNTIPRKTKDDDPVKQAGRNPIRVLVVDDHPAIREALSATIEATPDLELAGQAASSDQALGIAGKGATDVAIVDISLADVHGLDLVQNLSTQYPDVAVIVYSMYDERVYAERVVRAGASGYLMKREPTEKVVDAIRTVVEGDVYLSPRILSRMVGRGHASRSGGGFAVDSLTDREMAVFQMLGEGFTLEEIIDRLNLSRKTVEAYRRRAKEKLGLSSVGELLQHAIRWVNGQGTIDTEDLGQ